MAKTFIFAIGGTGARVLRSLTMLMAAGFKDLSGNPFNGTICPIIIDYDENNGDKDRAIECMKRYSAVHDLVTEGKSAGLDAQLTEGKVPFFSPNIEKILPNWSWKFDFEHDQKLKFRDYISFDNIGNYSIETQNLMECLYYTDNTSVFTELDLNMTQGFQGNPNIGSVVFDDLKNCLEFKNTFTNSFKEGDRIVVIGSIFGGTGSSGIPKIVAAIRNHNNTNIKNAEISVVLVLPYFAVKDPEQGEISIKSNIFNSKTKAALNYYESSGTNEMINNIYYVGDKVPTMVEPHIGDKEQKNNAHFVEMISAMSVLHVMTNEPNRQKGTKYKFNASAEIDDGIGLNELVGESATQWAGNNFVRNIIHGLINCTFAVRYFNDEIVNPKNRMSERQFYRELKLDTVENKTIKSDNGSLPIQDYCGAFHEFICKNKENDFDDGYWQWINELHATNHGAHALKIFNLSDCEICYLLHGRNFRTEPTVILGHQINASRPMLTYDDAFDSEMNQNLVPYREGQRKLDNKDPKSYPWIFNHVLYGMAESIRTFNGGDNLLPERFKLVP